MSIKFSISVDQAANEYPTIKTTVNLAKAVGLTVTAHAIKLTKKFKVYQHLIWFKYPDGTTSFSSNNNFVNMCRGRKEIMDAVKKENTVKSASQESE